MSTSAQREMAQAIKYALSKGFVFDRHKKHFILKYNNRTLSFSVSPSCPYAARNARADVDRILKESGQ